MILNNELKIRKDIFNKALASYLIDGHPKTLYAAARHLPQGGGKRLRPCIAMLSCESVLGDVKKMLPFAISVEFIHNFTLIHDDIMDQSQLRRNLPAVHIKFGEPTAIMAGDLLFNKAFEILHDLRINASLFRQVHYLFVKCVEAICQGQDLDMEFEKRKNVTEKEYIEMIQRKTAALFSLAAQGGVLLGGGTEKEIQMMRNYGESLGLAFQIWDDYLDISSNEETLGKDIGNDIRNGKKTIITVHSLNNAVGEDKDFLQNILGNKDATHEDIKKIFTIFNKMKSVEYAKDTAVKYSTKAKRALQTLKESDAKEVLKGLADFSINREK